MFEIVYFKNKEHRTVYQTNSEKDAYKFAARMSSLYADISMLYKDGILKAIYVNGIEK